MIPNLPADTQPGFASLGLEPALVAATTRLGYTQPTPVQAAAIPAILRGRDVLAGAETGSGKTAAFVLPLLQQLAQHPARARHYVGNPVRVLVLVPTRELAAQIGAAVQAYSEDMQPRPRCCVAHGGVSINPQMMALRGGADILVATPGRLLDLTDSNAINLNAVETLVLDEADRLLNLGFREELANILQLLPRQRQNLLFSATFPVEVYELIAHLMKNPVEINVATSETALIEQHVYTVDRERKNALLIHLIKSGGWPQVLVFASAKHACDRLVLKLKKAGLHAGAMHGDLSQGARTQALQDFKDGKLPILIATDVAARGIDIKQLPCVINFELPRSPNDYIHRIGRTGRAGAAGLALSLICPEEYQHFRVIEKRMKQRLPREQLAGFEVTEVPGEGAEAN
jgi:superfamily II DNA/RNA helicase